MTWPNLSADAREQFEGALALVPSRRLPMPWVIVSRTLSEPTLDALQVIHGEPWRVSCQLVVTPTGELAASRVLIEHFRDSALPVTAQVLRGVKLGEIIGLAAAELAANEQHAIIHREIGYTPTPAERRQARRLAAAADVTPTPGRRGHPDEHYRHTALLYVDFARAGHRDVVARIVESESQRLGRRLSRETVRDWIRGARRRGYLTTTTRGRLSEPGRALYRKENDG